MLGFVLTRLLAFALVLGVALVLILATFASVAASILTSFFDFGREIALGNVIAFVVLLAFSFAILYRILPDTDVKWRDVWPGALVAALLFAIGRWGVAFYLSYSSVSSAFEAAGALAIVLIAIYYAAQIFLFGAIFSKVYAMQFGSRAE